MNHKNAQFLKLARSIILDNLDNADFTATEFSQTIKLSRTHLHRKLKKLIGLSTTDFIRQERLRVAKNLLQNSGISISDVMYQVGFSHKSYFTKCFKLRYGYTPSAFRKRHRVK